MGSLATFNRKSPNGSWQLKITDGVSGHGGTLDAWSLDILSQTEASVTTTADGSFLFVNADVGTHHLRVQVPPAFAPALPLGDALDVVLEDAQNLTDVNFGLLGSAISGRVFSDDNHNGTFDPGENGLPGLVYDDLNNNGTLDAASQWTFASADVPQNIADRGTVASTLWINGLEGKITDLNVQLSLTHPLDSNLVLLLMAPDGALVTLVSHLGTGQNFTGTVFDDQAPFTIFTGSPPFSHTYRPVTPLSALNGKSPNGGWRLLVADTVVGNVGTLDNWSLTVTTNTTEPYAETDGQGLYRFENVRAGTHLLRQIGREGYAETVPEAGFHQVLVTTRADFGDRDFGNHATSVSGRVFHDVNRNGAFDEAETGLAGWTVYDDVDNNGQYDPANSAMLTATDTPVVISDGAIVASNILVDGLAGSLAHVRVTLSIEHPNVADLQITLISPQGTAVPLVSNNVEGENFADTTFDDQANQSILLGVAPFTGSFQPTTLFSNLTGEDLNGVWQLRIADAAEPFDGMLLGWSLELESEAEPSALSGPDGAYSLKYLAEGEHRVRTEIPSGYSQTTPASGFYPLNIEDGAYVTDLDFGVGMLPIADLDVTTAGNDSSTTWTNLNGPVPIANGSLTADSPTLDALLVTLVSPHPGDLLTATSLGNITVEPFDGGRLSIHGVDTRANYEQVLNSIRYDNTLGGPGVGSVSIQIVAHDGEMTSNSATATVTILLAPILDLNGDGQGRDFFATWNGSTPIRLADATATIADPGGQLESLTVSITEEHAGDLLTAAPQGNITIEPFAAGQLVLHGLDTIGNYLAVLDSLRYHNTDGSPLASQVTIGLVADNGVLAGNTAVATIDVARAAVVGRYLFYNESGSALPLRYDGHDAAINADDDNAIASDKTAYLPGAGAATFTSVSSYTKGINGIMIDLAGPHAATLTAADFIFRVGGATAAHSNSPDLWTLAPEPNSIAIRSGAGINGSDRVELTWANGAIQKTWLQVIVLANARTGLAQLSGGPAGTGDVFFFASAVADSGEGDASGFVTNAKDELAANNHPANLAANIPITNLYDYNRDGKVDSLDVIASRNQANALASAPRRINISLAPLAPHVDQSLSDWTPYELHHNDDSETLVPGFDEHLLSLLVPDILSI